MRVLLRVLFFYIKTVESKPDTAHYKLIGVNGGNTSGTRQPNVVVDIGFGDREYWAYTNEYGQMVRVTDC